jgi:hypothetical protein
MSTLLGAQARNLTIYWIDVEGGCGHAVPLSRRASRC